MPITFNLTAWQKKQATILYHYASFDYMKGLQQRFNELMAFIDPTLDLAKDQNRDQLLVCTRWECATPRKTGATTLGHF